MTIESNAESSTDFPFTLEEAHTLLNFLASNFCSTVWKTSLLVRLYDEVPVGDEYHRLFEDFFGEGERYELATSLWGVKHGTIEALDVEELIFKLLKPHVKACVLSTL